MADTLPTPKERFRLTNTAWADLSILVVLLGLLNGFTVGFKDWGWMTLNPSPWLLVPLFIGARYGFGWGVGSGLGVMVLIYAGQAVHAIAYDEAQSLTAIFSHHLFFFLSLPGIGFLTGETQGLISRKLAAAEKQIGELALKQEKLDAELDIAEESRFQLQEKLALFGAEHSNLDRQLRALFEPTAGAIFPNLLRLLRDMCSITDAGIYAVEGANLKRLALIGNVENIPPLLEIKETEMAKLAIQRKALTTLKELWQESPEQNGQFIAALPWLGGGGTVAAVLMIRRMQFLGTNWRNFNRIQMVCRWVAQYVDLRVQAAAEPAKLAGNTGALIVSPRALQSTLNQAQAVHRDWKLPSALATFEFTEPVTEQVAKLLPQAVGSVMRPTDVGTLEGEMTQPMFKVLMPMDGVADAESLLNAALRAVGKIPQLAGKVVGSLALTDDDDAATSPA